MKAFYERYWRSRGDKAGGDYAVKWPRILPYIPRTPGLSILEFGCGNGTLMSAMRSLNPHASYAGIDISAVCLEMARRRVPDAQFTRVADGEAFPFADGSIDFVLASEVLEHVYDTANAFWEISRVLRPGGSVLLTCPVYYPLKVLLVSLFSWERTFDPMGAHIRFYTRRSLFGCLRKVGLAPVDHGYYSVHSWPLCWLVRSAIFVLARKEDGPAEEDEAVLSHRSACAPDSEATEERIAKALARPGGDWTGVCRRMARQFDWHVIGQRIIDVYRQVASERNATGQ